MSRPRHRITQVPQPAIEVIDLNRACLLVADIQEFPRRQYIPHRKMHSVGHGINKHIKPLRKRNWSNRLQSRQLTPRTADKGAVKILTIIEKTGRECSRAGSLSFVVCELQARYDVGILIGNKTMLSSLEAECERMEDRIDSFVVIVPRSGGEDILKFIFCSRTLKTQNLVGIFLAVNDIEVTVMKRHVPQFGVSQIVLGSW